MIKSTIRQLLTSFGYEIRRLPQQNRSKEGVAPPDKADSSIQWTDPFAVLRKKWIEVPTSRSDRKTTRELLRLSDTDLLHEWEHSRRDITMGSQFAHRGWYHLLYSEAVSGKKVMDVGSGFAIDSITFAQYGAHLTFVDIAQENLEVVERLCQTLGIAEAQFVLLDGMDALRNLDVDYDIVMAMGSLHHAPTQVVKPEVDELRKHLKIGGRWLQLAYPKARWIRDNSVSFEEWGETTDGAGTPWAEWYDIDKLLELHSPGTFDVVLNFEFHNSDFIWFDLVYRGERVAEWLPERDKKLVR